MGGGAQYIKGIHILWAQTIAVPSYILTLYTKVGFHYLLFTGEEIEAQGN